MGDVCDLTQQHRVAAVLYICFDEIDGQIVEVAEVESCRYQVIFATRHLCRHPAYRVSDPIRLRLLFYFARLAYPKYWALHSF